MKEMKKKFPSKIVCYECRNTLAMCIISEFSWMT